MKELLKKILSISMIAFLKIKGVRIDFKSNIDYYFFKNLLLIDNKKTIIIKNSVIRGVNINEGCRIINSICVGDIYFGKNVSVNGPGTRIASRINRIEIGSYTSIASNVIIQEDYHNYKRMTSYFIFKNIFNESITKDIYSKGKILIEEDVWIGSNSVILSGVKIARGSVIGAGSVVTKNTDKYSVVAGNPAKILKYRFSTEKIQDLEKIKWWEKEYKWLEENKNLFN
ncbi:MAG: DapH/DapD/GlmU-related protein [Cetobacterium sp.]